MCKIVTWRSKLILAGRAGQRQALAKSVHPVEPDWDVSFRHSLQGFSGGKRELGGLVGKPRLRRLGMPWTAALPEENTKGNTQFRGKIKAKPMDSTGPMK